MDICWATEITPRLICFYSQKNLGQNQKDEVIVIYVPALIQKLFNNISFWTSITEKVVYHNQLNLFYSMQFL